MRPHAAALAVLFTVLACARGLPQIETTPSGPAPAEIPQPGAEPDPPPPATSEPPPAAEPEPKPAADEEVPASAAAAEPILLPGRVRVGLATDLEAVEVPCCAVRLALQAGSQRLELRAEARIEPVGEAAKSDVYRVQAAALRAETQATALASALEDLLGAAGEVVFDARDGLYRVRLGRYATRVEAERAVERLRRKGVHGAWVVSESTALKNPALEISHGDRSWVVPGRWLEILAPDGAPAGIPLQGKRYRGELLVYLNDRGSLNLINRLTLDDYLRGVVPREMGPEVYDDLEALKAQAVAARTYTLSNMGEFRAEGYDICATPRCQVYGGIASEHELSDRAVAETAGEVLMAAGGFADALYSSTCGGHTENVEVVFPSKSHDYLRGVPCLESGSAHLAGGTPAALIESAVLDRLLPTPPVGDLAAFADRSRRLASSVGLGAGAGPPRSLERREVHAYVGRLLELEPAGGPALGESFPTPSSQPAGWSADELRLATRLHDSGLMENRRSPTVERDELRRVLYRMAIYLRTIERVDGRYLDLADGHLRVKRSLGERRWRVGADVATFVVADGGLRAAPLTLVAGDAVSAWATSSRLLVLAQRRDAGGDGLDRPSRHRAWKHFRSDRELERLVDTRYPGLGFRDLEIVSRGVSGRVATLRLTGRDGERVEVEGLPIRWLLDLPDTLFTAEKTASRGGEAGWLFSGRGWGHGVGMCQIGAFGMARRGHGYGDILDHYYTGLELKKLVPASEPRPEGRRSALDG